MKFQYIIEELDELKKAGLYMKHVVAGSANDSWFVVNGKRVLNLTSNNYLGFSNDPEIKEAAKRAIDEFGAGAGTTPVIAGINERYVELTKRLAGFKHTEDCVLFQCGINANIGAIPALMREGDVIFSDELNHASIVDGCRLSKARTVAYAHNDMEDLETKIKGAKEPGNKMIITDGVFSMDGDLAPLPEIAGLARTHGCITYVDDSHGEGVLGQNGRGIVDHYGLSGEVDVEMGTLSKAFGIMGGFICGPRVLCDFLRQRARTWVFSTGLTPPDVGAILAGLDILERSDERTRVLWENTNYFKAEIRSMGFDIGNSVTPITPVIVGEAKKASEMSETLFQEGVFSRHFVYPVVAKGKARLRVMISAMHAREDLDFALKKFSKIGRQLGVIG